MAELTESGRAQARSRRLGGRADETQSYEQEHARIFQPLGRLYELARQAGIGVTHIVGALG